MNYTKNNQKMTLILFAGIIGMMIMSFSAMNDTFAQGGEELETEGVVGSVGVVNESTEVFVAQADAKINEFEQKALRDNEIPSDELLQRVGDKWLSSYKDIRHFEISEESVNKFVERNNVKDGLDKENAKLISKIHNFETITESIGDGHEIALLIAQLDKVKGKYNPSEAVSKYHSWIEGQYTVPTTEDGVMDRLIEILDDKKFVNLAKKHAQDFDKLAELGSVPIELFISDKDYWGEISHIANCERNSECDVDALKHQPGATSEEIEKIRQIEAEINDVSFDLWDVILPKAYAWTKVQVSYDLYAKIQLSGCYYNNCYETWDEITTGTDSIDHDSYGSPNLEHVYRDHSMYFYGRVCDNHTGSQTIINEVEMTPYLAQVLQNNLSDDDLDYNSCVSASHYDSSSSHNWIVGILVDSPGSYYWTNP